MCDGDQLRDTESDNINTIVSYDHDPERCYSIGKHYTVYV